MLALTLALIVGACGKGEEPLDTSEVVTWPIDGSAGCGQTEEGVAPSVEVDGITRTFEMNLPDGYAATRAYPLVMAYHGSGGTGATARSYFGFRQEMGQDAIVVYPDALPDEEDPGWDLEAEGVDVQFFDVLRAHLLASFCVDDTRIFVTGHSKGAYMSNLLGCVRPGSLTAIAPVAGGPINRATCVGDVAAWVTHGALDQSVPLSAGEGARDLWREMNRCDDTFVGTDPSPCVAYEGCKRDTHWCLHEGAHEWPDDAAQAIWQFFEAQ
jgi:polyhydroxybutyrate depolymerase